MKKKKIFVILAILVASLIVVLAGYIVWSNNPSDPIGTETVAQGTQMHYGNINVSLSSIENGSALMDFYNNETDASIQKQVKVGDTIDVFGYSIEIKSVKETANPSILTGSNHGYVKFFINKQ
ncbi:MAG TPA: hypothetical protein VFD55_01590 [Candidatus Angelobacter sp.]|nr:hypothetical protein [Candidatus Angelobacter sp.]